MYFLIFCKSIRFYVEQSLLQETEGLEDKKKSLQIEIQQLQMEKEDLEFILESHKPACRLSRSGSPMDIKPFAISNNRLVIGEMEVEVKEELQPPPPFSYQRKPARPRPNSLPVSAFNPRKALNNMNIPTSEMAGVPITTPTAGMPFNFDSMMDGGTGLTPVSGPLQPTCASQQRNGCVDLSSPDSLPNKLVSLWQ